MEFAILLMFKHKIERKSVLGLNAFKLLFSIEKRQRKPVVFSTIKFHVFRFSRWSMQFPTSSALP